MVSMKGLKTPDFPVFFSWGFQKIEHSGPPCIGGVWLSLDIKGLNIPDLPVFDSNNHCRWFG